MKIRRLKFIAKLALSFISAAVLPCHSSGQEKAKSNAITNELAVAEGKIISYSFLDDSRGTHQYTVRLSGYPATFQIPSDFAKYFSKDRFETNLKKGDSLSVWISAQSAGSLTSDRPVPVFAIRTERATYLDEYYTLGGHDDEINNNGNKSRGNNDNSHTKHFPALISFVFFPISLIFIILLTGLAFIIWKRKPESPPEPVAAEALIDESSQRLKKYATRLDSEKKSGVPSQRKPGEPPTKCPVCGAPAEKGYLYGADFTPHQRTVDETAGGDGLPPYAEALRCSSCKRITLTMDARADNTLQPMPVYTVGSSPESA